MEKATSEAYFDKNCATFDTINYLAYSIYIPNSFTPNDDGLNDAFGPAMLGIDPNRYKLQVFGSSNSVIYETTDPFYGFWNGSKYNHGIEILPTGSYRFSLEVFETCRGLKHQYTGSVLLIRDY